MVATVDLSMLPGEEHREAVIRSLITLKALTYAPTGGIVAAPTTSLPECLGGVRNWDYRYCWIRDATYTLYALLMAGYKEEASSWRDWLIRAVAGDPAQLQIMYGVGGERRLTEIKLAWLCGYAGIIAGKDRRCGSGGSFNLTSLEKSWIPSIRRAGPAWKPTNAAGPSRPP